MIKCLWKVWLLPYSGTIQKVSVVPVLAVWFFTYASR